MLVWVAEFDDYWYEVDELIDAGEGVVVFWRHGGVGKTSGIPTEAEVVQPERNLRPAR